MSSLHWPIVRQIVRLPHSGRFCLVRIGLTRNSVLVRPMDKVGPSQVCRLVGLSGITWVQNGSSWAGCLLGRALGLNWFQFGSFCRSVAGLSAKGMGFKPSLGFHLVGFVFRFIFAYLNNCI
ncbi:unnamed protein product [Linum trigynum]|uniref:Uncharacterized protein n=1 Tax=Linum trigynum TaxID=586398 RepID=A0AAV2CET9_9ROSI